jgi:hypothetical protein
MTTPWTCRLVNPFALPLLLQLLFQLLLQLLLLHMLQIMLGLLSQNLLIPGRACNKGQQAIPAPALPLQHHITRIIGRITHHTSHPTAHTSSHSNHSNHCSRISGSIHSSLTGSL